MVDKISINVLVSSINVEHNFLVPHDMSIRHATQLILQSLREEYPGIRNTSSAGSLLMQHASGKVLNPECSLQQLGIVQGEKFVLI